MKRAFWHLVKATLVCGLISFFSYVTSYGVALGGSLKFIEVPEILVNILPPFITLLCYLSVTATFAKNDLSCCLAYYDLPLSVRQKGISIWKSFGSPYILMECGIALLFFGFTPAIQGFAFLGDLVFKYWIIPAPLQKILYVALELLLFYICTVLAYHKSYKLWLHGEVAKEWKPYLPQGDYYGFDVEILPIFYVKTFGLLLAYLAIYWVCGAVFPAGVLILGAVGYILVKFYFIIIAVVAFVVFLIALMCIRAVMQRQKFMKRLISVCREKDYILSQERHPYRTLFFGRGRESFSIIIQGQEYSCTLVGSPRKRSSLMFGKEDILTLHEFRVYGRVLFRIPVHKHIELRNGCKNIFIVIPEAYKMFVVDEVGTKQITIGEKIFDYKIFGADDFLGNLSRNTLTR